MSWVKLATNFYRHPKAMAAGPAARNLYLAALAYCGEFNTDGAIPASSLPAIALDAGLVEADSAAAVARLLAVELWHLGIDEAGVEIWQVHDWADWQTTKAERKRKLDLARARKERWNERRAAEREAAENASGTRSERSSEAEAEAEAENNTPPTPSRPPKAARDRTPGDDRYTRTLALVSRERARSEPNVRSIDGLAARIRSEAEDSGLADEIRATLDANPGIAPGEVAAVLRLRSAPPPVVRPMSIAEIRAASQEPLPR